MTPLHWSRILVPPLPDDLPTNLVTPLPPLPLPLPDPKIQLRRLRATRARARAPEPLLLADAAGQVRVWFSKGASLSLIQALLNQGCPQQPRWTRRAVQKLLMATGRIHQGRPKAA
jgi:hypothetical protein